MCDWYYGWDCIGIGWIELWYWLSCIGGFGNGLCYVIECIVGVGISCCCCCVGRIGELFNVSSFCVLFGS